MSLSPTKSSSALLVLGALVIAVLLATSTQSGAATIYACKKPSGTLRLVSRSTRCRRGQTKIRWGTSGNNGSNGRNGANGTNGANGLNGVRGPAGAFNVVDQGGANIGLFAGFTFFGTAAYTPSGVLLIYDNLTTTVGPSGVLANFFYRATGCTGTPYTSYPGSVYPWGIPTILANPPAPGSQMYSAAPGTLEANMAYQSFRTATGCTNSAGTATNAYQARASGLVPIVQEPLTLQPIS